MLDTKGPEIFWVLSPADRLPLKKEMFTFTTYPVIGDRTRAQVLPTASQDVHSGQIILLADGTISMEVQEVTDTEVHCR